MLLIPGSLVVKAHRTLEDKLNFIESLVSFCKCLTKVKGFSEVKVNLF